MMHSNLGISTRNLSNANQTRQNAPRMETVNLSPRGARVNASPTNASAQPNAGQCAPHRQTLGERHALPRHGIPTEIFVPADADRATVTSDIDSPPSAPQHPIPFEIEVPRTELPTPRVVTQHDNRSVNAPGPSPQISACQCVELRKILPSASFTGDALTAAATVLMGLYGVQNGLGDGIKRPALETARIFLAKFNGRGSIPPFVLTLLSKNKTLLNALSRKPSLSGLANYLNQRHTLYGATAILMATIHTACQLAATNRLPPALTDQHGTGLLVSGLVWAMQLAVLGATGARLANILNEHNGGQNLPYAGALTLHGTAAATALGAEILHITNGGKPTVPGLLLEGITLGYLLDFAARANTTKPIAPIDAFAIGDNVVHVEVPLDNVNDVLPGDYLNLSQGLGKPPHPFSIARVKRSRSNDGTGTAELLVRSDNWQNLQNRPNQKFTSKIMQEALSRSGPPQHQTPITVLPTTEATPNQAPLFFTGSPLNAGAFSAITEHPYRAFFASGTGAASALLSAQRILESRPIRTAANVAPPFFHLVLSTSPDTVADSEEGTLTSTLAISETPGFPRREITHNLGRWCMNALSELITDNAARGPTTRISGDVHFTRGSLLQVEDLDQNNFYYSNERPKIRRLMQTQLNIVPPGATLHCYACGSPIISELVKQAARSLLQIASAADKRIQVHTESAGG